MNVAPDMVPLVYGGGALLTMIVCILFVIMVREFMDQQENGKPGVNKRMRYMMRFVYETHNCRRIGYYSTNTMKPFLQDHPKYAMVITGYPAAKSVFDDYAKLPLGQVKEQFDYPYAKCKIVLMEERSYFGIKAWYDLTSVDLVP